MRKKQQTDIFCQWFTSVMLGCLEGDAILALGFENGAGLLEGASMRVAFVLG